MKTYDYAFRFTKEGDGWVITCRDLPEAISQANAKEDRNGVAEGCLQAALESRIRETSRCPSPARRAEARLQSHRPPQPLQKRPFMMPCARPVSARQNLRIG